MKTPTGAMIGGIAGVTCSATGADIDGSTAEIGTGDGRSGGDVAAAGVGNATTGTSSERGVGIGDGDGVTGVISTGMGGDVPEGVSELGAGIKLEGRFGAAGAPTKNISRSVIAVRHLNLVSLSISSCAAMMSVF